MQAHESEEYQGHVRGYDARTDERDRASNQALRRVFSHGLKTSCKSPEGFKRARQLEWLIRVRCEAETVDVCTRRARHQHNLSYLEWVIHRARPVLMGEYLVLHAAAVSAGEQCILFPGQSGSGKTTLAAELVLRGLDYFGDEQIDISLSDSMAYPFPKALSIKARSSRLFENAEACAVSRIGGEEVRYVDAEDLRPFSVANNPCQIGAIIFPEFCEKAQCEFTRLSPGESVLRLFANRSSGGRNAKLGLDTLVKIASMAPSYRLVFGSPDEACDRVLEANQCHVATHP